MGKRSAESEAVPNHSHQNPKRQKIQPPDPVEEIFSARQLQDLLAFRQDDPERLRIGLVSLKAFLENIIYVKDDQNRGAHLTILGDFLDASKPKDPAAPFLTDLIQSWSFSVQTSNERLASSVSSLLALILKTLSGILELREHGLALCRTLLQREQLKLFSRGVSSESHKEHLISPCLRLLTEVVSFDGGALAYQVFDQQDLTLNPRYLDRNLRLHRSAGDEDHRRLSVRSNTVRYLIAHLRFQPIDNRVRLLENRNLFKTLFDHVNNDPIEILRDLVRIIESHVLGDDGIPRKLKSATLTDRALTGFLEIVRGAESISTDGQELGARGTEALKFITRVSTSSKLGVLLPHGWYPPGSEKAAEDEIEEIIDHDKDTQDTQDRFTNFVPVRNLILSNFLQTLRPHASIIERSLALTIFGAAPELVASYFCQNRNKYSLEPKLTNTWIGYASFFFSAVELPVPQHFGRKTYSVMPPPISVIMENVLPSPLTQKVMTRCLNQSSDLITLFAVRILITSLNKLKIVMGMLLEASKEEQSYEDVASRLSSDFVERCPALKDIVAAAKKSAESQSILKESTTRLIRLYQEILPQLAVEDSFDVAVRLVTVLEETLTTNATSEIRTLSELELQHLIAIASHSAGMKWWHKQGSLPYSTFTTLLQVRTNKTQTSPLTAELGALLASVLYDSGILHMGEKRSASFDALLASFQPQKDWTSGESTFKFIDECIGRLVRKPVKYLDDLDLLQAASTKAAAPVSLLTMVCLEQAPFLTRESIEHQREVLTWISRFVTALNQIGEDKPILEKVRSRIKHAGLTLPDVSVEVILDDSELESVTKPTKDDTLMPEAADGTGAKRHGVAFTEAPEESNNHPEIRRWQKMEVEEAIQEGVLADLELCLCSQYTEIRLQGLSSLKSFDKRLVTSGLETKEQFHLLIAELIETAETTVRDRPLPYIAGSFAARASKILTDPTHLMYPKVNKYLLKDPIWNVRRLPEYWLSKTVLDMPDDDDQYWKEVAWVMDMLVDGLRTVEDVGILRSRNVFERILALAWSPGCTQAVSESIFQLVYRAICAGGSSMLVTGCGIVSWLKMHRTSGPIGSNDIAFVAKSLSEKMDQAKVHDWSGGLLAKQLLDLQVAA